MYNGKLNILLIEDSKTSAMVTTKLIKSIQDKYMVILAQSLKEGIEIANKEKIDLALLDLILPDSSGISTFKTFKENSPDIPVVILSGLNKEKDTLKIIELGAQDYIFKEELSKQSLKKSILYALERHKFSKTIEQKNRLIKESEKMSKEILHNYPDGIFLLDKNKRILLTNNYGSRFFEKSEKELIGSKFSYPVVPSITSEIKVKCSGEDKIAELTSKEIHFNDNIFFIVSLRDITEKKKLEEKIEYYATKDSLTDFYNRRYGLILTEQSLKMAKRKDEHIALCFVDIDNLKYTNDKFGHSAGDELIKTVAEGITNIVRDSDIITRLGGDEFLITFMNSTIDIAKSVMSRVEYKIYTLAKEKKLKFEVSISKGFSEYNPDDEVELDRLVEIADSKMYEDKLTKKKKK
jgi:diguanylate cyclase (GGDEF)-like protein